MLLPKGFGGAEVVVLLLRSILVLVLVVLLLVLVLLVLVCVLCVAWRACEKAGHECCFRRLWRGGDRHEEGATAHTETWD